MKSFRQYINENRLSDLHILVKQGLSVEKVNAILQLAELLKTDWRKVKDITNESVELGEATERAYPVSYEKNKRLMTLVKKYDDPLKFILKVMTLMNAGKLKLTRVGVANTREVAALWNAHKNKKISPSLIEHLFSEIKLLLDED